MKMKKKILNENAIIQRLSDGQLSVVYGGSGYAQKLCGVTPDPIQTKCEQPVDPLCKCLAGCACAPAQEACNKCIADI